MSLPEGSASTTCKITYGGFLNGVPRNGCFLMENPMRQGVVCNCDDLGFRGIYHPWTLLAKFEPGFVALRPVPTGMALVLCKEHLNPRGVESETLTFLSAGLLKMFKALEGLFCVRPGCCIENDPEKKIVINDNWIVSRTMVADHL